MTIAERVEQIVAGWPDEPSDELADRAVRVWASIDIRQQAA